MSIYTSLSDLITLRQTVYYVSSTFGINNFLDYLISISLSACLYTSSLLGILISYVNLTFCIDSISSFKKF